MTNKYCDSPIHKCLCLFLALIFFFAIVLSIPASADADPSPSPAPSPIRPNEPVGWHDGDTFRDILLVVLDSWGISFSKSDPSDDVSILEYSDYLLEEFYEDNETNQELFWDLVKYGVSDTGNIILDFLGVNKIRQFANWLVDKFSLSDDSSVDTSGSLDTVYSLDGYPCFLIPYRWEATASKRAWGITSSSYVPAYFFIINASGPPGFKNIVFFARTTQNFSVTYFQHNTSYSNTASAHSGEWTYNLLTTMSDSYVYPEDSYILPYSFYTNLNTFFSNLSSNPVSNGTVDYNLTINTTTINIPSDNDITPNDGLQIEVPGTNWGDSIYTILNIIERLIGLYDSTQLNINTVIELISTLLQGLQKSVAVENIPGAVVLDFDEYDIPLETEWSLVDGFFSEETEGSPFSTLTTILYGLPEPFILFFSVIVVFVIAYGFIRLGRDSH